jgi:hypothetical protein
MVICSFCDREPTDQVFGLWMCDMCLHTLNHYVIEYLTDECLRMEEDMGFIGDNHPAFDRADCWDYLLKYFYDDGWQLCKVEEDRMRVHGHLIKKNVHMTVCVWLEEEPLSLNVDLLYPNAVPKHRRHAVLDLINRLNYDITFGKFLMYHEDGSLLFNTAEPIYDLKLIPVQLNALIGRGSSAADDHYPKFMHLIYGDFTVKQAMENNARPHLKLVYPCEENDR